jgi:hypothetical protein
VVSGDLSQATSTTTVLNQPPREVDIAATVMASGGGPVCDVTAASTPAKSAMTATSSPATGARVSASSRRPSRFDEGELGS